jgi:arylsulfatase A-like enzyme/tetratricopeptide (TPR) repeat protein
LARRRFRYTFILVVAAAGATLAAVGGWRFARASAPVSGPIVLISIDALRADRLPAYGYQSIRTPAIAALSADGVVFERAYSHAPMTLPSHATLLSGRLPFETGVRGGPGFAINGSERMLAEMLDDRGYATGAVISSFALRRGTGINQGFSFFDGTLPQPSPDAAGDPLQRDGAVSERIAEEWLQSIRTPRAFLFLHLAEPHRPHAPPERFTASDAYDGEIAYADEIVGRLIKYLKTHQLYDQSTIILVSDHGEGLGDHGESAHGLLVHEEAVRVPLIIKPAAGEGAGRRVREAVQLADVTPTILDLAKAPIPGNLHGQSLKPAIDGSGRLPQRLIYSESLYGHYHFGWAGITSVTDGRYRLIRSPDEELYDLLNDPAARVNVVDRGDLRDVRASMAAALAQWSAGAVMPTPADVPLEDRDRFEALGYVGARFTEPTGSVPVVADVEALRAAVDRDVAHDWRQAIAILQGILKEHPASADVWARLAAVAGRAGRYESAIAACERVLSLRPADIDAQLAMASALWRLRRFDEAQRRAEIALSLTTEADASLQGSAHELLARIALNRRDAEAARTQAGLAEQAERERPVATFVEARLLQEDRQYDAALALFERAAASLGRSNRRWIADLEFFTAETLVRLERYDEAEYYFLEELRRFPLNTRARSDLASLYHTMQRHDDAFRALADLVRLTPTAEVYLQAARLSQSFGEPRRAAEFRLEASRLTTPSRRSGH